MPPEELSGYGCGVSRKLEENKFKNQNTGKLEQTADHRDGAFAFFSCISSKSKFLLEFTNKYIETLLLQV